ncbi:hypothetical protein YH66_05350 [[Brevibacterium] flavum]|uniref:Uncharacterized protein n=1 Tax=[Brevibacterium] flavum TaxID=92706 RepID=A0A0F6WQ43_9CORY|nr:MULTISPECIES: hypothetical protein [Corynebacterium]AKF27020.1 hypothetical protein YH66_05350 [[Brevibacterium] flavum]ANE07843.1 hypothetical protein A3654_05335 [Corynebacterium glutamicum]AST20260.1 hypothetical protein CEY17_05405 [Corynebacterium glutamicum ATCC 14067]KEI22736.1 hypothetical protein KIQ_009190 [Corynebacterium glutamicum ATCC 14067]KIH74273.1 hypothetical protein SD36_05370 [Corynebacterium glutamicum]
MSDFIEPFAVQFFNDGEGSTFTIPEEQRSGRYPRYAVELGPGRWTVIVEWPGFEGITLYGNYLNVSGWYDIPIKNIPQGELPNGSTKQSIGYISVSPGDSIAIRLWRVGNITEPHVTGSVMCIPTPSKNAGP